jgi:general secretion pathway protein A
MYEDFYSLNERPFSLTPNPRYVFYSSRYREASDELYYGIERKEGFMLLTGWPGTGKTTLCRDLLEKLEPNKYRSALVFNPFLNGVEMQQALLTEFGVPFPLGASRNDLLNALNAFLLEQLAAGRTCVAVFDEAQHMSTEFLEQIRVLSNLETSDEKLIQIVLVGQPELLFRIKMPGMAQLDQRVSVRSSLTHLNRDETKRYLYHRLDVAGARGRVDFSDRAVARIYRASQGIPRRINAIADQTLLAGYVDRTRNLGVHQVKQAIASLRGDEADGRVTSGEFGRRIAIALSAAAAILAGAGAFLVYRTGQFVVPRLIP